MKVLAAFLIVGVATLSAAPACTPTANILNYNGTGGCESLGLLFSGFVFGTSGAGTIGPQVVITIDTNNPIVTFNLNPNQGSSQNDQTSTLAFNLNTVSGAAGITGASSANGGTPGSSIRQVVCAAGTINFATGACGGILLQDVTNVGGTATLTQYFAGQSSVAVWRQTITPQGNTVTGASFDFAIPEPLSIVLLGSGLLALGIIARRARKI
ncbi:MAG: PEP-CTERM sorting domain-containing protein [Bryobacteraceae bacterium]